MGCFDSTCSFTRLPIHEGDEMVYVEWTYRRQSDIKYRVCTYDFLTEMYNIVHFPQWEVNSLFDSVSNLANRHPEFNINVEEEVATRIKENKEHNQKRVTIIKGEYNDYGGIGKEWEDEEVYPPEEIRMDDCNYFFVHKAAFDAYAGSNDTETLYNLVQAAYLARVELFLQPGMLLGAQYSGSEFIEAHNKIRKIVDDLLPNLFCSYAESEEESKSDWDANAAMTDEQILAAIANNPDDSELTDWKIHEPRRKI